MGENSTLSAMPYIGIRAMHKAISSAVDDLERRMKETSAEKRAEQTRAARDYFAGQDAEILESIKALQAFGKSLDDQAWDLVKAKHPSAEGGK